MQQRRRPGGRRGTAERKALGGAAGPRLPPHVLGPAEGGADGKRGRGAGPGSRGEAGQEGERAVARGAAGAGRSPREHRSAGGAGHGAATVKFGEGFVRKVGCAAPALELSRDAALAPADTGLQGPRLFPASPLRGPARFPTESAGKSCFSSSFLFFGPRRFEPESGVLESPGGALRRRNPSFSPSRPPLSSQPKRAGLPCSGRSFAEERKSEVLSSLVGKRNGDPRRQPSYTPDLSSSREGPGLRGPLEGGGSMGKLRFEEPVH